MDGYSVIFDTNIVKAARHRRLYQLAFVHTGDEELSRKLAEGAGELTDILLAGSPNTYEYVSETVNSFISTCLNSGVTVGFLLVMMDSLKSQATAQEAG